MPLDVVAIITCAPGKEAEGEALMSELAAKVTANEPGCLSYKPYKRVGSEGESKYVVVER
jgi:quinol monooxygenase YgiN